MVLIRYGRWLCLWLLLVGLPLPGLAATHVLKFATLAPEGSTWMNLLQDWGNRLERASGGRLRVRFYPGGIQGDEPDVIRKMRFGQLQGAALTGYGIGRIYAPARVLEIPFLFRDDAEIDHVRQHLMPTFEQGFRQAGYELVAWMEVGWVYFFSREPIRSLDDLRQRRIWLWQGDILGQALFDASGLSPVPLSITDVYTSLSTGLIDTVYCTPLAAIALQWFNRTHYVADMPMANGIGAILVSERFFRGLPADLQALVRKTGAELSRRLIRATRADDRKSLAVLRRQGLQFLRNPDPKARAQLLQLRDRAAAELIRRHYIPRDLYDRTRALIAAYRKRQQAQPSHGGH